MTDLFLVLLASAWLVLLGPAVLKARRGAPLWTAQRFRRGMEVMAPKGTAGRWVLAPHSSGAADRLSRRAHARSQRRRKQLLVAVVALVPATIPVAILEGGLWWGAPGGAGAVLVVYLVLLVRARKGREQSLEKVRSLAERRADTPAGSFEEATGRRRA